MKKHTQEHKSFWASGKGKAVYLLGIFLIFAFVISLYAPSSTKPIPQVTKEERILFKFEKAGVWEVDKENHRCLISPVVWNSLPFKEKENMLQIIYREENTFWEIYDMYSGKLLGKVSSWGVKVYP